MTAIAFMFEISCLLFASRCAGRPTVVCTRHPILFQWWMASSIALCAALLKQLRDESRPARLMARSDACTRVAVEVFVEEHEIPPVLVLAKPSFVTVDRPRAVAVLE